jgi:CRP-like cAMP-binding protein
MTYKPVLDSASMYESLGNYISRYIEAPLPEEEFNQIKNAFQPRLIRKRQYLLQEGEICRYTGFLVKGAMRQYFVDAKGNEHILRFAIENWWVGDRESFSHQTPSKYNIDALEESELLIIDFPALQQLRQKAPSFVLMMQKIDERSFIAAQKRIHASIIYTAEERYLDLVKSNPDFLQRFSQNMIASYLGITPETLSRVRKHRTGNN